jgi:LmbE family N-acetylglucosaminyl deacetylase
VQPPSLTRVPRPKDVLCVLAHQDDELAVSTRIARELASGHRVVCVFLTDGGAHGSSPARRDAESLRVLERLGVARDCVLFPGGPERVPDGRLPLHLARGLRLLEEAVRGFRFRRVYTLAYEGGHQDHDAAHLIALAFARSRGLLRRTWQAPLYQGEGRPWRLFRVHRPLAANGRLLRRRLGAGEALRHALLALSYPSQWRTWLGLFPAFAWSRGARRHELLQPVDPAVLGRRPHPGPLLYERLFGFAYEEFAAAARRELGEHLA